MPRLALLAVAGVILAAGCGSSSGEEATGQLSPDPLASDSSAGADLTIAAAGDLGMAPSGIATLETMAEARPDLYLGLGDFSYAGPDSADDYCELVHSTLGEDAPFEIVAGNHEEDSGEDGQIESYADCLPDRVGAVGEYARQYYFDVGGLARLIMISPDLTINGRHYYYGPDDDGADTPELAWLKEAIDGARADGIQWVVVAMHKPCINVGEYYCDIYQDLFTTLIAEGVDIVLAGHDHTYQRSKQIAVDRPGCPVVLVDHFDRDCVVDGDDTYRKGAGTPFVISGAGGAELYQVHADDAEAGYFVATMGRNTPGHRHGFALLTLSPERLDVRFVGSTPGSFGDRFAIEASGP
jgi:hypothetical protein